MVPSAEPASLVVVHRVPPTAPADHESVPLSNVSTSAPPMTPQAHLPAFVKNRSGRLVPLITCCIVGTCAILVGRFVHPCAVTFDTRPFDIEQRETLRKGLFSVAWSKLAGPSGAVRAWYVDEPEPGRLRLSMEVYDRSAGVDRARSIADAFLLQVRDSHERTRSFFSEWERILGDVIARLDQRSAELRGGVEEFSSDSPSENARSQSQELQDHWWNLRATFDSARSEQRLASEELVALQSRKLPDGTVPAEDRRAAQQRDSALQQDLRELKTQLVELKFQLLNVWQQSSGLLDQARSTAQALASTISSTAFTMALAEPTASLETIGQGVKSYLDIHAPFQEVWSSEFALLRRFDLDPQSGEWIDLHQRLRTALGDFLFRANKSLSALRVAVQTFGGGSTDSARHLVLLSELTRGFEGLQQTHHRLEFSLAGLDPTDNFRLDACLRSARGLRRRTQERILLIDRYLQTATANRERDLHAVSLANAERRLAIANTGMQGLTDDLIAFPDLLIASISLSLDAERRSIRRELATDYRKTFIEDAQWLREQVGQLATQRKLNPPATEAQLVECGVAGLPVNLTHRITLGVLVAFLTFATVRWLTSRFA